MAGAPPSGTRGRSRGVELRSPEVYPWGLVTLFGCGLHTLHVRHQLGAVNHPYAMLLAESLSRLGIAGGGYEYPLLGALNFHAHYECLDLSTPHGFVWRPGPAVHDR